MSTDLWKLSMLQLTAVEQCNDGQQQVDLYYDKSCKIVLNEMDVFLKIDTSSKKSRKKV